MYDLSWHERALCANVCVVSVCACAFCWQVLADRAVEEMQGVIRTLVRKGTTTALRTKVRRCYPVVQRGARLFCDELARRHRRESAIPGHLNASFLDASSLKRSFFIFLLGQALTPT